MNDFTIISLPRVHLELPPTSFDLKSLKVSLQPSMPCHYNLKTIQREKILKESKDVFVKYQKKKRHINLIEYLNKKRSYSTVQRRKSDSSQKTSNSPKKESLIVFCHGPSNRVQTIKQMKIKKQIFYDYSLKMEKGNLYSKLSKRNISLEQHLKRLQRYHQVCSLPVFISVPQKISYSPTPRNLEQKELIKRRFIHQKRSLGSLSEIGKDHKYLKSTMKDYKIEGWNMKQSKNGFGVEQNL